MTDPPPATPDESSVAVGSEVSGDIGRLARARSRIGSGFETAASQAQRHSETISTRFNSPLHDEWVASVLGICLGVSFTVCFLTGIVDYLAQHPPHWFHLPTHPVNLFGITEGVHVITGVVSIPLLIAKLWSVWPKLFSWPPVHNAAHALERLSLIPLVGGSLFLLFTGVVNIDYWYSPMSFFFPTAHFWTAWMVVGALVIHVGAKTVVAREALARGSDPDVVESPDTSEEVAPTPVPAQGGLTRRGFVATIAGAAGVLLVTTVGEAVGPLRRVAVLAPRNPDVGPQELPVNQSAAQAGVTETALDPGYRLAVMGNCSRPASLTLGQLQTLPQREASLPITCVEGWTASGVWRGISLPALLARVGAAPEASVRVESLEAAGRLYSSSVVDPAHTSDPDTLLALQLNGAPLDLDHGYPVRLIAPDRPGVLQTKWIDRVVVL